MSPLGASAPPGGGIETASAPPGGGIETATAPPGARRCGDSCPQAAGMQLVYSYCTADYTARKLLLQLLNSPCTVGIHLVNICYTIIGWIGSWQCFQVASQSPPLHVILLPQTEFLSLSNFLFSSIKSTEKCILEALNRVLNCSSELWILRSTDLP